MKAVSNKSWRIVSVKEPMENGGADKKRRYLRTKVERPGRNDFRVSKEKPRGEPRHNGVVYAIVVHHYLRPINRIYAKAVDLPVDHGRTSIVSRKKLARESGRRGERVEEASSKERENRTREKGEGEKIAMRIKKKKKKDNERWNS